MYTILSPTEGLKNKEDTLRSQIAKRVEQLQSRRPGKDAANLRENQQGGIEVAEGTQSAGGTTPKDDTVLAWTNR